MNARTVAALFAAVALPVAAQTATPRVATPAPQAKVQKDTKDTKQADAKASPRERAKAAKAKRKQARQKATAT